MKANTKLNSPDNSSKKAVSPLRRITALIKRLAIGRTLVYLKKNGLRATVYRVLKGAGPMPVDKRKLKKSPKIITYRLKDESRRKTHNFRRILNSAF